MTMAFVRAVGALYIKPGLWPYVLKTMAFNNKTINGLPLLFSDTWLEYTCKPYNCDTSK
jgi:hypothetical protein